MKQEEQIIIQTQNLTKMYGEKTVVNQLNLSIRKGEVFGLLGPNGAGKTTTILMLLGLTEPTGGRAVINGMDCTRNPIAVKSRVGYLPDNVGFYGDMTGRQNLRFTGRLNGIPDKELDPRIDMLLERVNMQDAADQKAGTYSRGMRQRLGVADVLMKDPEIIIMDEPTLGIDPEGMRELLDLIWKLSKEDGRTLLISSHQLYQVQQICDRVGIFVNGNLVACGGIDDLGRQVQKETHFTLELKVNPCDDKLLAEIYRHPEVTHVDRKDNTFIIESNVDLRRAMSGFLGTNGYTIQHMHQRGGDLDEIYRLYFEKAGQSDEDNSVEKKTGKRWIQQRGKKAGKA
ncbi:MAG: ABC transporter ATP-binding protein [Eubacteriales bacterium]|nr:ABC transporter ATP-binding protein [Eubacteriales bacterium]